MEYSCLPVPFFLEVLSARSAIWNAQAKRLKKKNLSQASSRIAKLSVNDQYKFWVCLRSERHSVKQPVVGQEKPGPASGPE